MNSADPFVLLVKTAVFSLTRMDGTFNPHGTLLVNYFLLLFPHSSVMRWNCGQLALYTFSNKEWS